MNYYQILKVSENASQQEIRDSYKKLIKQYHPDIYKGDYEYAEKITKELNDAYAILSNEENRKEYDALLHPLTEYNYNSSYQQQNIEYDEPLKPSIEDIMKEKIYNIVDEKTSKMNRKSKILLVILVILFALLLTALAINDYIKIIKISTESENMHNNTVVENIINNKYPPA